MKPFLLKKLITLICIAAMASMTTNCHSAKKAKDKQEQAKIHYQLGRSNFDRGDYISALRELRESVKIQPEEPEAQYWLGTTYLMLEHYSEAETHLKNALKLKKDYPDAYNTLGMIYMKMGRWDEAIAQFDQCLGFILYTASFPMVYTNMGNAYMKKGDPKKAEESFRQALRLNNRFCPAHQYFGEFLSKSNRQEEAIIELENVIQFCPDSPFASRAHIDLGIEFSKLGKKDEACRHFQTATKDPNPNTSAEAAENLRLLKCP